MSEATVRLTAALAGRYRIERRLGEGGMATVDLAEDVKHPHLRVAGASPSETIVVENFFQELGAATGR